MRILELFPILRHLSVTVAAATFWLCCSSVTLADTEKPQPEGFFNPLEITTPDPLLPHSPLDQPLSLQERLKLSAVLDELNQQAQAQLKAGDTVGALEIWNRELRLRRTLGSLQEVEALGRVGAIAWNEKQSTELQIITKRLQEIQRQAMPQPSIDLNLMRALGSAFQQVRSPKLAIEVYEQILAALRQQQDSSAVEAMLKTLTDLYLSWFNYPKAAAAYEELLSFARAKKDRVTEVKYLQELAYVYEQIKQPQHALPINQQLAELYLNEEQFIQLPALRLVIASDYEALGKLKEAFRSYQEAYASAWSLQQYSRASDALRELVGLYRSQDQIDAALQTSQILLEADKLGANFYGMMNTYDQIAKLYLKGGNYREALAALQNALELAQQLDHQETYFAQQIKQVSQQISK